MALPYPEQKNIITHGRRNRFQWTLSVSAAILIFEAKTATGFSYTINFYLEPCFLPYNQFITWSVLETVLITNAKRYDQKRTDEPTMF
jgi:hypothetical protein